MKYIDAEKLKAEIEKRMEKHWDNLPDADSPEDDWTHNELCELGAYKELEHIEDFLNSLQQDKETLELCSKIWWEEQGWIMIPPNATIKGIDSLLKQVRKKHQQEQLEENNLPSKRTRVNYAICNLQSFKPLREAIVLDDYVYDEDKCYRENLLNYIHAIPENRLKEIRHYLQEKGWWPYNDDADWMEQEQPEVDLEKEIERFYGMYRDVEGEYHDLEDNMIVCPWYEGENQLWIKDFASHFYELGLKAKEE